MDLASLWLPTSESCGACSSLQPRSSGIFPSAGRLDPEDLLDFLLEYAQAVQRVTRDDGAPLSLVENVADQWRKSAYVLRDAALRARLGTELDAVRQREPEAFATS